VNRTSRVSSWIFDPKHRTLTHRPPTAPSHMWFGLTDAKRLPGVAMDHGGGGAGLGDRSCDHLARAGIQPIALSSRESLPIRQGRRTDQRQESHPGATGLGQVSRWAMNSLAAYCLDQSLISVADASVARRVCHIRTIGVANPLSDVHAN
jgi:hypothetical protein